MQIQFQLASFPFCEMCFTLLLSDNETFFFFFFGKASEIKNSGVLFNVIVSESLTFGLSNKKRKNNVSYANLRPEQGM